MNYDLPEEATIMRQTVRDFAEKEIKPVAQELDEKEEYSPKLTKKMGDLGLFGIYLPEEYGGAGMSYLDYIIAVEEISRIDGSQGATIAAHNSLGIGPIYYFGTSEQKEKYLPKLTTGEKLWGFGLTEPDAGSDAAGSKTTAVKEGENWKINGSKIFITNATPPHSLGVTVQAVTGKRPDGKKKYSCFLLEHGTKGFSEQQMKKKLMWRSSMTSQLFFDDVVINESQILGSDGEGFHQMLDTLDKGRLSIAAMGLGCAQGAYELGLAYAKERKAFGKSISSFQINAFKLADMFLEIENARNLLYKATWMS